MKCVINNLYPNDSNQSILKSMKDQKVPNVKIPLMIFLSFFGVGFIRWAPGTFGSLATLPILYFLGSFQVPIILLIPFTIISIIGTCFLTEYYQKLYKVHDPQWIVIDEVLGMLVTWFFWPTSKFFDLFLAFLLFRFFDIFKIWPASYLDQKVQHGAGTILDDIVSGLYAGCIHLFLQKFFLPSFATFII